MPFSDAFHNLQQTTSELWAAIDECTASFNELENRKMHDDSITKYVKDMQKLHTSALNSLGTVRAYTRSISARTEGFAKRIKQFDDHISRTTIKYGLNKASLIPHEVFAEIFTLAAETLEEKVALSRVCKTFRAVMMSRRKMWDGYCLEIGQTPEQMVAIAEGHRLVSLKAVVHPRHVLRDNTTYRSWAIKRGLDPDEYQDQAYATSLQLILSLCPEELQFVDWSESGEKAQQILSCQSIPTSHTAVTQDLPSFQCLDPLYQNRMVKSVSGATVAGSLIRCRIGKVGASQLKCLTEFLGTTKLLQELSIFLLKYDMQNTWCLPHLPQLQRLEVNFVPRPFICKSLTRLTLRPLGRFIFLRDFLEFLSSTQVLQELAVDGVIESHGVRLDFNRTVTLPSLVSCEILDKFNYENEFDTIVAWVFLVNIRMPALQRLKFRRSYSGFPLLRDDISIRNNFRASLQSLSMLQELEVEMGLSITDLDEIIRFAPPHLESFSVLGCLMYESLPLRGVSPSPGPQRRAIRFAHCTGMTPDFINIFAGYLKDIGLGRIKIELDNCQGWRDGMFGLDNIVSAWLNV